MKSVDFTITQNSLQKTVQKILYLEFLTYEEKNVAKIE